ncbi:DUF7426 family protein [Streptomyces altiplanensis]
MARQFAAVDQLLDDALELPVPGKDGVTRTYRIEAPTADQGLRIQRLMTSATRMVETGEEIDTEALDDAQELDLYRAALGSAYDALCAEVDWAWLKHTALTAVFWVVADAETAERYWAAGGDPEKVAPAQNRQQRRAGASSAVESKTPRRASTSGTSTRPAKPRKSKAAKG